MINNLANIIKTSVRFSIFVCLILFLFLSLYFFICSTALSFCLSLFLLLLSPVSFFLFLSVPPVETYPLCLIALFWFLLLGRCLSGIGGGGCLWVKTSKTLSFNDFDTSQVCWLCLCWCLPEDFGVWSLLLVGAFYHQVWFSEQKLPCSATPNNRSAM